MFAKKGIHNYYSYTLCQAQSITHIHTHTDRHTIRHTHTQTIRHTHTHTDNQTHTRMAKRFEPFCSLHFQPKSRLLNSCVFFANINLMLKLELLDLSVSSKISKINRASNSLEKILAFSNFYSRHLSKKNFLEHT